MAAVSLERERNRPTRSASLGSEIGQHVQEKPEHLMRERLKLEKLGNGKSLLKLGWPCNPDSGKVFLAWRAQAFNQFEQSSQKTAVGCVP